MREREAVLAVVEVARPIILSQYRKDSCVASTRIGLGAFRRLGIPARPLPVEVAIFNPTMARLLREGTHPTLALADPRAWSVGAGPDDSTPLKPKGWKGHLVILTESFLVDLSLDQFARPERNLDLEPIALPRPEGWPDEVKDWATWRTDAGIEIMYRSIEDWRWRNSPDWRRKRDDLTAEIEEIILDNLGPPGNMVV